MKLSDISTEISVSNILILLSERCPENSFCLLRDLDEIEENGDVHDIDCYIDKDILNQFLPHIEIAFGLKCIKLINSTYLTSVVFFSCNFFVKFDFEHRFCWRGIEYFRIDNNIASITKTISGISFLSPGHGLYLRIVKDLLSIKTVPAGKFLKLRKIMSELNERDKEEIFSIYPMSEQVFSLLTNEPKALYCSDLRHKIINQNLTASVLKDFFIYLNVMITKLRSPYGKLVVLVGPDGCGKTTTLEYIQSHYGRHIFSGVIVHYSRPNILPRLSHLANKINFLGTCRDALDSPDIPDSPDRVESAFRGSAKVLYYSLDFLFFRLVLVLHKLRGRLVIFDRYYYDYEFQYFWSNLPNWVAVLGRLFAPKPDCTMVLHADPHIIYSRKPELSVDTIMAQYDKLIRMNVSNKFFIRTGGNTHVSRKDILDAMFSVLKIR